MILPGDFKALNEKTSNSSKMPRRRPSKPASYNCDGCLVQMSYGHDSGQMLAGGFVNSNPIFDVVGFPHNSWLMKLAKRPKNKPGGALNAMMSPIANNDFLFFIAKYDAPKTTPRNPPWKDIPPSHKYKTLIG